MISPHLLEAWAELTAGETMATWRAADLRSGAEHSDDIAGVGEGEIGGRIGDTRLLSKTELWLLCDECQGFI